MFFSLSRGLAPSSPLSFCQSFHCFFLHTAESGVFSKVRVCAAQRSNESPSGAFVAAQTRACLGRRSRLIMPPAKRNRAFPTGNALLCISLLSVALIASFTSGAILNNLFAMAGCVLFRGAPCFCFYGNSCCSICNERVISANAQCSGLIQNPPRKSCTDLATLRPIGAFPPAQQCIF